MKSYGTRIKKEKKREIETSLPVHSPEKPVLSFSGINVEGRPDSLCFIEEVLDKNTLFVGPMGCGKTNCLNAALMQITSCSNGAPVVVADVKGDYSELLEKHNIPAVYLGIHDYDNAWNQFEDFLAWDDGTLESAELRAEEFAQEIFFPQRSQSAPYFADAAAILFGCLLKSMLREAAETGDRSRLNNAALKEALLTMKYEDWVAMLDSYEDFGYALSILNGGEETSRDANGVLSEIAIVTNKIYTGAFAKKGSFSPVRFIKSRKGRILVLRSDTSLEERALPVMSVVLNSMLRALGSRNASANGACFILDEFGRIPNVTSLETALSLLRGKNVRLLAGMQITGQMERQKTSDIMPRSLLDLFTNIVYMGGSGESLRYFQQRCGDRQTVRSIICPDGSIQSQIIFRPAVEAEDVMQMKKGDAYVQISDSSKVFYFHFTRYLPQT